jgi:hypothetical protein
MLSTYADSLSSGSPKFFRSSASTGYQYYQALRVIVYTSGTFTFQSTSSMDTYGCFYDYPVDPSYPTQNLITSDDDRGGDHQFRITVNLTSTSSYVLLVTTYGANVTGNFSITVSGPSQAGLYQFAPSTSRPITKTPTTTSELLIVFFHDSNKR